MSASIFNTLVLGGLCLCFAFLVISAESDLSCPGPTKYYKEIGCTPVFNNRKCHHHAERQCPKRYDCDHIKKLPADKCFVNGRTYKIDEPLREEDKNPCDVGCYCSKGSRWAEFVCAVVDCFYPQTPGCYMKRDATSCCGGPEVCPKKDEDRATCIVDGKKYRDGEFFQPAAEPQKRCFCGEGYKGKNVAPFCVTPKSLCGTMLHYSSRVRENCVPYYYYDQSPQTSCSIGFRCQNERDVVIKKSTKPSRDPDMRCKFGNLTMNIGDELNQETHYDSVCIKCVCEMPPVPTCQRLSPTVCDPSKHRKFD